MPCPGPLFSSESNLGIEKSSIAKVEFLWCFRLSELGSDIELALGDLSSDLYRFENALALTCRLECFDFGLFLAVFCLPSVSNLQRALTTLDLLRQN